MDLNTAVQWQQVTCRRCKRTYQCTPEDDYYGHGAGNPGPADGVCFGCLMILSGRDPDTTAVRVIDQDGTEWDPRDLASREAFEAASEGGES
jgi:hypothetical protein